MLSELVVEAEREGYWDSAVNRKWCQHSRGFARLQRDCLHAHWVRKLAGCACPRNIGWLVCHLGPTLNFQAAFRAVSDV